MDVLGPHWSVVVYTSGVLVFIWLGEIGRGVVCIGFRLCRQVEIGRWSHRDFVMLRRERRRTQYMKDESFTYSFVQ